MTTPTGTICDTHTACILVCGYTNISSKFLFKPFSGWVTQTIFIDCSNPDFSQKSNQTKESNQQCPTYLLSGSEDGTIKLWDLTNKGAIVLNLEQCAGISCMISSKLKGRFISVLWNIMAVFKYFRLFSK